MVKKNPQRNATKKQVRILNSIMPNDRVTANTTATLTEKDGVHKLYQKWTGLKQCKARGIQTKNRNMSYTL